MEGYYGNNPVCGPQENKANQSQITPKGVDLKQDEHCTRDIVVCVSEIWYKAYVTQSTGIFRCL